MGRKRHFILQLCFFSAAHSLCCSSRTNNALVLCSIIRITLRLMWRGDGFRAGGRKNIPYYIYHKYRYVTRAAFLSTLRKENRRSSSLSSCLLCTLTSHHLYMLLFLRQNSCILFPHAALLWCVLSHCSHLIFDDIISLILALYCCAFNTYLPLPSCMLANNNCFHFPHIAFMPPSLHSRNTFMACMPA